MYVTWLECTLGLYHTDALATAMKARENTVDHILEEPTKRIFSYSSHLPTRLSGRILFTIKAREITANHVLEQKGATVRDVQVLTHEWFMSHTWTSHVSHVSESCLTCEWVMSRSYTRHVRHYSFRCETWLIHMRDVYTGKEATVRDVKGLGSCLTCERAMTHVCTGKGAAVRDVQGLRSCLRHECFIPYSYVRHVRKSETC